MPAPPVRVRALQYHTYDGHPYHAGEEYEADPQYLETLLALQYVARVEEAAAPAKRAPAPEPPEEPPPHLRGRRSRE